ncbi:MAG: AAA family ATPase [Romboutsia timonensis]
MRLYLENIGKLSQADIDIKGITVIAGENNTGKSTVGKVLFAVFNSLYNLEQEILDTRIKLFAQELTDIFEERNAGYILSANAVSRRLFKTDKKIDLELIYNLINRNTTINGDYYHLDVNPDANIDDMDIDTKFLTMVEKMFYRYRDISAEKVYLTILNRTFKNEFDSQIINIYSDSLSGNISLKIKDKSINLSIVNNQIDTIDKTISSLKTKAVYIDDPLILDNISSYVYFKSIEETKMLLHKKYLLSHLIQQQNTNDVEDAFHEVIIEDKLKNIMNKISKICGGTLSYKYFDGFLYYDSNSKLSFNIKNISAGLKTFAIIKTLLYNGSLKENGTIILDEPEVHLHPEWQILLAEIIVLLHKEFNMHILLTTHSPYFLEAIEVYSQKYEVNERCKYYLAENHGDSAKIDDVTHNTEAIYKKLAQPFQDLENERYNSD